jgi:hypothetical protein
LFFWLTFSVPSVLAQQTVPASESSGQGNPALPYAVAILATMIVMVIICMPSRKR